MIDNGLRTSRENLMILTTLLHCWCLWLRAIPGVLASCSERRLGYITRAQGTSQPWDRGKGTIQHIIPFTGPYHGTKPREGEDIVLEIERDHQLTLSSDQLKVLSK
jgi:hypothetical protein